MQQKQQLVSRGGTHYGNMYSEAPAEEATKNQDSANSSIVIAYNQKAIPVKVQNKSRIRLSTESIKNAIAS